MLICILEDELSRLLGLAGVREPLAVETVAGTKLGEQEVAWHVFLCRRETGDGKPAANGAGYGFRIEFPEAVHGTVAVGAESHFGMGFKAESDRLI